MAELIARFGANDAALLRRVLGTGVDGPGLAAPHRVVLDAHVPEGHPEMARTARQAGVPLLIDPQTYYLQDSQHPADPWALLPFARPQRHTPVDLLSAARLDELVATCLEYQLEHGASVLVAPYVHVETATTGWVEVQLALWRRTRRYLVANDVQLPVVAVVAVGWRLLARTTWPAALDRLLVGVAELGAQEIALAASKVDRGRRPDERLADLVAAIRRCRRTAPVIAWQQGLLGEAAVVAGAIGYETGIGWRERCDLQASMAQHRSPAGDGRSARPVFVEVLRRSIPRSSLEALLDVQRLAPDFLCMDFSCCSAGRLSLLGDARAHALTARARELLTLSQTASPAWRWNRLALVSSHGLQVAERVNAYAGRGPRVTRVDVGALLAVKAVADNRRQTLGRRRAA